MDPFYGSYPLGLEETFKYPVNRILDLNTPLEIDFTSKITRELVNSSQEISRIDSLFESESELSEISQTATNHLVHKTCLYDGGKKEKKLKNPFREVDLFEIEKDFIELKGLLKENSKENSRENSNLKRKKSVIYRKSDDNCTVCLGNGELVCCDSCPRVFHLNCLNQIVDLKEKYECKECVGAGQETFNGMFKELLQNLEGKNPRIFSLPANIVNSFENIIKHPKTGDFLYKSDVEFINLNSSEKIRDRNPTIKNKGEEVQLLKNAYCYKCSRSNMKLSQTNLLCSFSINQPNKGVQLQSNTSDLIKCDFCPLFWHLDCLDPPLANVPPELRENEIEIVDQRSINAIKEKIWGDSVGAGSLNSRSILDGLVSIRKKWMCPCHSQNVGKIQASGWKWCTVYENPDNQVLSEDDIFLFSNSSRNNGQIDIRNEEDTNTLFHEMDELTHSKRSIGPIDRFEINGIRYRVPEKRIKLDFLAKSNGLKYNTKFRKYQVLPNGELKFDQAVLDHMFPGFNSKVKTVHSNDSLEMLLEAAKNINESSISQTAVEKEYLGAISQINNTKRMKKIKPKSIIIHPDDPEYLNYLEWKKRNPIS